MIPRQAHRLTLYINASNRHLGQPLYRSIIHQARESHLAGASAFLVDLSFGTHRQLRDAHSDYLFLDIPILIELIDAPDTLARFHTLIAPQLAHAFATLENLQVLLYRHHETTPSPLPEHPSMPLDLEAQRLTIYLGSSDTYHGSNLASAIVERCRQLGLAGATASLGVMGFGKNSRIHRAHLLGLSEDLPERIEIIDRPEKITQILPILHEMLQGGLVTLQPIHVLSEKASS